jgi:hypothetical protein
VIGAAGLALALAPFLAPYLSVHQALGFDRSEGLADWFGMDLLSGLDPGGFSIYPSHYAALQKLWRDKSLSVRVAYSLFAQNIGAEFEEYKNLTQFLPMGFGDDMLRFNGIGERITWAMNNNEKPTEADKEKYYQIVKWAAERGMSLTMHWTNDGSVDQLLSIFERVNKEVPIGGLRWSIAHLNSASAQTLRRMKALGMGWTVQDALYFGGTQVRDKEAVRREPPVDRHRTCTDEVRGEDRRQELDIVVREQRDDVASTNSARVKSGREFSSPIRHPLIRDDVVPEDGEWLTRRSERVMLQH